MTNKNHVPIQVPGSDEYDYYNLNPVKSIGKESAEFDYGTPARQEQALDELAKGLHGPRAAADLGFIAYGYSKDVFESARIAVEIPEGTTPQEVIREQDGAMRAAKNAWYAMSLKLIGTTKSGEHKRAKQWADRLNASMQEVYALPSATSVNSLIAAESDASPKVANVYGSHLTIAESKGQKAESLEDLYQKELSELGTVISNRYGDMMETLIPDTDDTETYDSGKTLELITNVLDHLKQNDSTVAWHRVKIQFEKDSKVFSVSANEQGPTLNVPEDGESLTATALRGMISHELLWHAARAANGAQSGDKLQATGMPNSVGFEEGGAVASELTVTGKIDQLFIDRYIDIAIAAGEIDGQKRTRPQMQEFVFERYAARTNINPQDILEEQKTQLRVHIDRMYRGGTGNNDAETAVIFPKDGEYYGGVFKFLQWWKAGVASGKTPEQLYDLARAGANDLSQQVHADYLASLSN